MSFCEVKMHQIRFRLGLRPRPHWGSLQRSPDPLAGIERAYFREGKGRGTEGKVGWEGKKERRGGTLDAPPNENPAYATYVSHTCWGPLKGRVHK